MFQNILFVSSCRQTLTCWAQARSKLGSAYLEDQDWRWRLRSALLGAAGLTDRTPIGRPRVLPAAPYGRGGASQICAACAQDLHYVLTCKYWFIPVPELPYQMMPNHAEMSGSFTV